MTATIFLFSLDAMCVCALCFFLFCDLPTLYAGYDTMQLSYRIVSIGVPLLDHDWWKVPWPGPCLAAARTPPETKRAKIMRVVNSAFSPRQLTLTLIQPRLQIGNPASLWQ